MSSNLAEIQTGSMEAISAIILNGDLSRLNTAQRAIYVKHVCEKTGLDYLTRPFDFITLNGKLTLYANKGATDQLRKVNKVSVNIVSREKIEDLIVVTARAKGADGREDESVGAVSVIGLKGENLANAMMKAETKAKRRVTLSLCGLGMLDESEVADIPDSVKANVTPGGDGQPSDQDGILDDTYRMDFGKYPRWKLEDIASKYGKDELIRLVEECDEIFAGTKKLRGGLTPERAEKMKLFVEKATAYIVELEKEKEE